MTYEEKIRRVLLRYPHKASEVKVYIEPSLSGCDHEWLSNVNSFYKEVNTPAEADYIPLWIDYKNKCSSDILNYIDKYPDKCISSFNLIESVNAEMDEITDDILQQIQKMLASSDWESVYLGLSMMRNYYLNDECKNTIKCVIDTFELNYNTDSGTIIPFLKSDKDRISVSNLDIIRFYTLWMHNKFLIYD